jgi:predicted amidohydrolase YtcJ
MYISGGAAANFEWSLKGSVSPGKMADFVVLNRDPFMVSPDGIKDVRAVMTVLGGRIVWSEGSFSPGHRFVGDAGIIFL